MNTMLTKEQLQGILISLPKPEVHVSKDTRLRTGYKVRLRLNVRAREDFLLNLQRTLLHYGVESNYKETEHASRNKPILRISGIENLLSVMKIMPDLPDAKGHIEPFIKIIALVAEGAHLTQEGLDDILTLKGWI